MGRELNTLDAPPAEGLGRRAARGGVVVFASMALQKVVALGVMGVLARLLTPEDYGLIGMVFAFTAFVQVFSDLGLTMATVQKRSLTMPQISTIFWMNLLFSICLAGIAAAMAPGIGWFFNEPRLVPIALLSSAGFIFAGLGMQHTALMTRRMQFKRLAVCDLASLVAGGATGITMALRGWGAYALVGQMLAQTLTRSLAAWTLAGWVPGLPVRRSGVREMLKFGGYLTGFNVLNYFARNMDKVLLGRFWGAGPVGLYTRAYSLMTFPITFVSGPMSRVMIPALSRLQDDKERYAAAHLRAMRVLALISFPLAGGLAVMAEEAILVVFGPNWIDAVPIFRVLCIAGMFQAWMNSLGWVYTSSGDAAGMLKWATIGCPVLVAGVLPGIIWGPMGAAIGYTCAVVLFNVPFGSLFALKRANLEVRPILEVYVRGILIASVVAGSTYVAAALSPSSAHAITRLLIAGSAGLVALGLAAWLFGHKMLRSLVSVSGHLLAESRHGR